MFMELILAGMIKTTMWLRAFKKLRTVVSSEQRK